MPNIRRAMMGLVMLSLMVMVLPMSVSADEWAVNNTIVGDLCVKVRSAPTVFQKDSVWYLISGEGDCIFNGWEWNGSQWVVNNIIIGGLYDIGGLSSPTVFQKDSVWYLISGEDEGVFNGWEWSITTCDITSDSTFTDEVINCYADGFYISNGATINLVNSILYTSSLNLILGKIILINSRIIVAV